MEVSDNFGEKNPVLQIQDVYPGSEFFPSRIQIKESKYFMPKIWFLSSRKYDPGCSSRIKKAPDPGSGPATLRKSIDFVSCRVTVEGFFARV
jgi:hypothetical protein